MAYIGKGLVGVLSENKAVDTMSNPNGVLTTMTLSRTPGSVNNVEVYIDGVFQTPGDEFTLAGDVLTFTTAPATNAVVIAVVGNDSTIANVDNNTITGTMFPDGSVTDSKISDIVSTKISGTLPALDGSSLTNLTAGNLQGTLPALDGSSLTSVSGFRKNASDPLSNSNGNQGDVWVNTTSGEVYVLTNHTVGSNIWTNIGGGTGNIIVNVLPGMPTDNFASSLAKSITHNHTFIGGTDTGSSNSDISGAVTHYVVDQISNAALTVASSEVAAGNPHVFTTGNVGSDTNITFRVRSKDNDGGFSADRIISVTIIAYTGMVATGGTITTDGDYKVHSFTTSGSFSFTVTAGSEPEVEYLVIAGGGSGSAARGGGGGAGGYRTATGLGVTTTSYSITVGGGGAGVVASTTSYTPGNAGSNSSFDTITATGGGGGGHYWGGGSAAPGNGEPGGSGGGGGATENGTTLGGSSTAYGNNGGNGYSGGNNGGGGGGAGSTGGNATSGQAGDGGAGLSSDILITGQNVLRAGGGGGGFADGGGRSGGAGGSGGGSTGTNSNSTSTAGTVNTGSGSGGGNSGNGGSGIVIIRYKFQ
jgi:hypothetical protein